MFMKSIKKAQFSQKTQYDKKAKDCDIVAGDLVMIKVEPRFKLDRNYKGPYRVMEVTATNGIVKPMYAPDKDCCSYLMAIKVLSLSPRFDTLDWSQ